MPSRLSYTCSSIVLLALVCFGLSNAYAAPRPSPRPKPAPPITQPTYSYDGTGNNSQQITWGSAGIDLLRFSPASYGDQLSALAGATRPSAREISNILSSQTSSVINNRRMSDFVYVFGQFLDHDIDLTPNGSGEKAPVSVPSGDQWFDPMGSGTKTIGLTRSAFDPQTGSSNSRQQINSITAWVDGSQIYGSDATRAGALRSGQGGKLKTSSGNMLPFNRDGLPNANDSHMMLDSQLFLAGDIRANENPELVSLQTLFVREHNRLADQYALQHPDWTDEQTYQAARRMNIAQLQNIVYQEFLPALMGRGSIPSYRGYNPRINPGIANEFSTAAFRFGHSLLDGEIARMNDDGSSTPQGSILLRNAFFNTSVFDPSLPNHQGDIDPFLKSASQGNAQEIDLKVVDDIRNFLFGPPGSGGFDLAALNIQRGRDHGLADYNTVRAAYGLRKIKDFSQITSDPVIATNLKQEYGSVDNIDLWVGGLAEDHLPGSSLGPTFQRIIMDQFLRLRDGDRLYFENQLRGPELEQARHTRLSDLVKRNTSLVNIQKDLFFWKGSTSS